MSLKGQVGGDHYKKLKLEPFEVTLENFGYEGLAASVFTEVQKYMLRRKDNHIEDLEKAKQCIDIQIELYQREIKEKVAHDVRWEELMEELEQAVRDKKWEVLLKEYPNQKKKDSTGTPPSFGYMYGPVVDR